MRSLTRVERGRWLPSPRTDSLSSRLVFRQSNEKLAHKIQRQIKQTAELTGKKE